MATSLSSVELEDLEELALIDGEYSGATGVEGVVNRATVHFYQRSGHSFVMREGEAITGFVLAHASWSGGRPVVRVERLVAPPSGANALVDAVVKSAYDAGVYDVLAAVPTTDVASGAAFIAAAFKPRALTVFSRVLGSRGAAEQPAPAVTTIDQGG